jgi:hypothetical protein
VKKAQAVRNYYVLPCCLLLLNLCNNLVSYKAGAIADPWWRVMVIIALVLVGGTVVAFVVSPAIETIVRGLHKGSRDRAGWVGEFLFLGVLGVFVFWLYWLYYVNGPEALLPREWWNRALHRH